jgi:TupA-like ATPgrasp
MVTFRRAVGYFPNVARPVRYSDLVLWRKIFDHNPLFVTFSDKLATKRYVAQRCPDLALARVLWTGTDAASIPMAALGRPLFIKSNNGSGQNLVVGPSDSESLPVEQLNGWVEQAYGQHLLEWAYADAERALMVEEVLGTDDRDELVDLMVHTVDGIPVFLEAILGNKTVHARKGYFRPDGSRWPELERKNAGRAALPREFQPPPCYREAMDHARVLGSGIDYLRIDFMCASGCLYGGEITVYPGSGLTRHTEFLAYNALMAQRWDVSKSWFLTSDKRGLRGLYARALERFLNSRERH